MTPHPLELPIGESSFRAIRSRGFYYVDKTPHLHSLTSKSSYYFLSRPRRLARPCWSIPCRNCSKAARSCSGDCPSPPQWDGQTTYPVVRLSCGSHYPRPESLHSHIHTQLAVHEQWAGIHPPPEGRTGPERLQYLITRLHEDTGQLVVVVVDEYDKPVLDGLEAPELAQTHRDTL